MIFKKKQDAAVQQTAAGEAKPAAKGGKAAAFFRKNWKWMVPVVCVAVLGGWFILRPDKAQNANTDINYVQVSPSKRDVSNTLSGTGTLNPANTYNVKSLVAGKVLTSSFEEGDIVEEGTVLYTVDSSDATTKAEQASIALQQAQRSYDKTADRQYVRAEVAGVVSALKVAKGDEVTSGQEVAVIRDSSKMVLRLEFPAADAATFSVGQSAEVTLDGTFEMLTGTVTAVTGTDALSTGNLLTRTVTIAVRNAGGLTTAQAATATINGVNCIAAKCFEYQAERTLTALAAGTVTAINVPEGGAVNKDDIVLQISGEDLTEAIQSAAESLRSAELNMDNLQEAMNNYTITSPISGTIIEKNAKAGDALSAGSDLCTIFDLSYLEMTLNVDELQVSSLSVGQSVQVTADAVPDKTYTGVVTRVSLKGTSNGGTTTYPVKVRIDETDGLRPGMNANAEIVVAQAKNTLTVPNAAIVRGGYVLVTQDSPSAVNADPGMIAPDGYVYVPVKTGVSDDNYTQIVSGLTGNDTVDALSAGSDLCTIFDLSYLEMTLNVDELQVSSLSVGQSVQVTADAVPDKTYTGVVTRVSLKGTSNGGTTTYPVKVRIDETDGLRPGMNANAEIVVAQAKNTLTVPNAAIVRGGYVLVTQDSPSAVNADPGMIAPDGYVYVPVKTGVSDDNYTQIVSGLTGNDTVAYDSAAASTDTYYDDGGYYEADAEGTEGEEGADAANSMVDEEEPENGTVPAEEPVEAEEKQGSAGDDVNPSQADGVVYLG